MLVLPLYGFGPFELSFSSSDFSFYQKVGSDGVTYDCIQAPGYSQEYYPPGAPQLPVKVCHYIIPRDKKVDSVKVIDFQLEPIPGSYYIYPIQKMVVLGESSPWVPPDTSIYNSDSLYPGEFIRVAHSGSMEGSHLVTIGVYPIQYRPLSRNLHLLASVSFVFYLSSAPTSITPGAMDSTEYQQLQMFLSTIVSNPQYVPLYMPPPPPPPIMLTRYIIITDASLVESFEPLAEWLTDKGVPTEIVTTQYIYSHYSPEYPDHPTGPPAGDELDENGNEWHIPGEDIYEGENAGRIRNFLKDRYASSIGLRYVLLGGDDALVPVRYCSPDPSNSIEGMSTIYGQWCPADLYFADLSGDWNCGWHSLSDQTPDDYWGVVYSAHDYCNDSPDVWPELKIGRVLVRTPQEVTNWVNKRLCYEWYASRDRPDFDNLTTALWIYDPVYLPSSDWDNYQGNYYTPELFPGYITDQWDGRHWHKGEELPNSAVVLSHLSNGPGFVNINCHGGPANFNLRKKDPIRTIVSSKETKSEEGSAGLNWLTNDSLYNIIYAISCEVAWFDTGAYGRIHNMVTDNTIADAFTDTYSSSSDPDSSGRGPIGATAFLGNTRDGLGEYAQRLQYHFWDAFWNWRLSRYRPSIAEAASKINYGASGADHWYLIYVHNFFGCPEMEAWTEAPKEMIVNLPHDLTIPPGGGWVNLTVTVWDAETGDPVYRARVCLNKPGDVYTSRLTNWLGCANFSIYIHSSGWMRVTVTRQHTMSPQYLPYRDSCYVYYSTVGKQEPSINPSLPKELTLNLLSSNPLTHPLNICYGVPKKGMVKLVIYDPLGRRVKTIADEVLSPNWYRIRLDPKKEGLACGIYWLVLEQDQRSIKKKLVILR